MFSLITVSKSLCFWKKHIKLITYIDQYLALKCCARNYTWKITTVRNTLILFEQHLGRTLYTDSFSVIVCEQLLKFLQQRNLRDNSIRDIMRKTQSMLNRAKSEGYSVKNDMRHLIPRHVIIPQVYLTTQELKNLYDLSNLTPQKEIIRDTFLIGCYTGLRLSDLVTLDAFHIVNDHVIKLTRKTCTPVSIPLHPVARRILAKYNNQIPKLKSIQYYNREIKNLCKQAGINQLIRQEFRQGGKIVQKSTEKFNLVSSHTGRRTAITNLYFEGKVDLLTLQKFSGHSDLNTLISYIKASDQKRLSILSESAYFKEENIAQNHTWSLSSKNYHYQRRTRQLIKRIQRYVPSLN